MEDHMHVIRRLALLPDEKLEQLMRSMSETNEGQQDERLDLRQREHRQERLAVISRELRDRGILGPPWWSQAG